MKQLIKIIVFISFCCLYSVNGQQFTSVEARDQSYETVHQLGLLNGQSENSCTTNFCVSNAVYTSTYYTLSTTVSFYLNSDVLDFTTTVQASFNQYSTDGTYNYLTFSWEQFSFMSNSSFSATSQYTYLTRNIAKNYFDIGYPYSIVEETSHTSPMTSYNYDSSTFQLGYSGLGSSITWRTPKLPSMTYYFDSGIPDFVVTGAVFSLSGQLRKKEIGQIGTMCRTKFISEYRRSYYYFYFEALFHIIYNLLYQNLDEYIDTKFRRTSIASETYLLIHIAE